MTTDTERLIAEIMLMQYDLEHGNLIPCDLRGLLPRIEDALRAAESRIGTAEACATESAEIMRRARDRANAAEALSEHRAKRIDDHGRLIGELESAWNDAVDRETKRADAAEARAEAATTELRDLRHDHQLVIDAASECGPEGCDPVYQINNAIAWGRYWRARADAMEKALDSRVEAIAQEVTTAIFQTCYTRDWDIDDVRNGIRRALAASRPEGM
jgi:hypothetical protein